MSGEVLCGPANGFNLVRAMITNCGMQQTVPQLLLSSENAHFDGVEPPKSHLEARIHQIEIQKMYFFRKNHQKIKKCIFSKIVPSTSKDILDDQKRRKKLENRPKTTPEVSQVGPTVEKKSKILKKIFKTLTILDFFLTVGSTCDTSGVQSISSSRDTPC